MASTRPVWPPEKLEPHRPAGRAIRSVADPAARRRKDARLADNLGVSNRGNQRPPAVDGAAISPQSVDDARPLARGDSGSRRRAVRAIGDRLRFDADGHRPLAMPAAGERRRRGNRTARSRSGGAAFLPRPADAFIRDGLRGAAAHGDSDVASPRATLRTGGERPYNPPATGGRWIPQAAQPVEADHGADRHHHTRIAGRDVRGFDDPDDRLARERCFADVAGMGRPRIRRTRPWHIAGMAGPHVRLPAAADPSARPASPTIHGRSIVPQEADRGLQRAGRDAGGSDGIDRRRRNQRHARRRQRRLPPRAGRRRHGRSDGRDRLLRRVHRTSEGRHGRRRRQAGEGCQRRHADDRGIRGGAVSHRINPTDLSRPRDGHPAGSDPADRSAVRRRDEIRRRPAASPPRKRRSAQLRATRAVEENPSRPRPTDPPRMHPRQRRPARRQEYAGIHQLPGGDGRVDHDPRHADGRQ